MMQTDQTGYDMFFLKPQRVIRIRENADFCGILFIFI